MLPLVVAAAGLGLWLFTRKAPPNGPTVLAAMTTKYGTPIRTQNWPAASGRIYRVTGWASGNDVFILALGGSWGNQPSAPDSLYSFSQTGDDKGTFKLLQSSLPDANATTDMVQLRTSLGI